MIVEWPTERRGFLLGLGALVAAPAIARAASLMPIKPWRMGRYGCLAEITSAKFKFGYHRVVYKALDGTFAGLTKTDLHKGPDLRAGDIVWVEGDSSRVVPVNSWMNIAKCMDPTAKIALRSRPQTELDRWIDLFIETNGCVPERLAVEMGA